jgi:hypothetical protein
MRRLSRGRRPLQLLCWIRHTTTRMQTRIAFAGSSRANDVAR